MNSMLKQLGTSHTGFFHEKHARAAGRIAIAATLMKAETGDGIRWMFQDVHPGGVAAQAGIQSGDVLLKIGDKELVPPDAMPFVLGETYSFTVRRADGSVSSTSIDHSWIQRETTTDRGARSSGECVQAARRHRADPSQHVPGHSRHGCGARHQPRGSRAEMRSTRHRPSRQHRRRHWLPAAHESTLSRSARRWIQRQPRCRTKGIRQGASAGVRPDSHVKAGGGASDLQICASAPFSCGLYRGPRAATAPWPSGDVGERAFGERRRNGRGVCI